MNFDSLFMKFPLDWTEEMTLSLILFTAGLLCLIFAVLLAVYLLKSDRFTTQPKKEEKYPTYPETEGISEESRFGRFKSKIKSFFKKFKGIFSHSEDDYDYIEDIDSKSLTDLGAKSPESLFEDEPLPITEESHHEPSENEPSPSNEDDSS